jgi:hypothetical protein
MPDAVPSLEEVESTLLGGATPPDPSSADYAPDTTQGPDIEPAIPPTGGGIELAPPELARPAEAQDEKARRITALEAELETEKKRRIDTQANFHRADQTAQWTDAQMQAWEQMRQREAALAQQAQHSVPPGYEKPDELIEDPKNIADFVNANANWAVGAAMAQFYPYMQALNEASVRFEKMEQMAVETSFDKAAAKVTKMGYKDFDEQREAIKVKFMSEGGERGRELAMDPEMVVNAYLFSRRARGLPMNTGESPSPTALPITPSVRPGGRDASSVLSNLSPYAKEITRRLGVGGMKVTEDDLERVGLLK